MSAPPPTRIWFRVEDVFHPSCAEVLWELYHGRHLLGELMAVTDDGSEPGNFLVLRVSGLSELVLLPSEKALPCDDNEPRLGVESLTHAAEKTSANG